MKSAGGMPFSFILALVFIVLKLTGYIDWSWWWVLAPIWVSAAIGLVLLLIVGVVGIIRWRRNRRE